MSIKSNLTKRRPRKVTIDGDEFFVVSMTLAEADHVDALGKDASRNNEILGYCLTRCLVEADGENVLAPETTDESGKVVFDPVIKDIPIETATALAQKIRDASTPPDSEAAKKN